MSKSYSSLKLANLVRTCHVRWNLRTNLSMCILCFYFNSVHFCLCFLKAELEKLNTATETINSLEQQLEVSILLHILEFVCMRLHSLSLRLNGPVIQQPCTLSCCVCCFYHRFMGAWSWCKVISFLFKLPWVRGNCYVLTVWSRRCFSLYLLALDVVPNFRKLTFAPEMHMLILLSSDISLLAWHDGSNVGLKFTWALAAFGR